LTGAPKNWYEVGRKKQETNAVFTFHFCFY
jgi:hypothetical protein